MKKTAENNKKQNPDSVSDHGKQYDDEALEEKIIQSLSDMYDDVLKEPIPEELLAILQDDE